MHGPMGESSYTKSVSRLVKLIQDNSKTEDSLFEQAKHYFDNVEENLNKIKRIEDNIVKIEDVAKTSSKRQLAELEERIKHLKQALRKEQTLQKNARLERVERVTDTCANLLLLAEGDDWESTQINSAKVLGTLQLLSPGEGAKLVKVNQSLKPAYRAVVAIRLIDKLMSDGLVKSQYIDSYYTADSRYSGIKGELSAFQREVCVPIIITALFQDIGLLHKDAQLILKGEDGDLDEFRVLENEDRLKLLKINHANTLDYITNGLGLNQYVGNSKDARDIFNQTEEARFNFTKKLLLGAHKPNLVAGNLIKIPQIYASIVLSTKSSYNFLDLPKACMVLEKAAEQGAINKKATQCLLSILGHFPQGFGITYIPKDDKGKSADTYEYAIVIGLNPDNPYVPICRAVTRQLTFISGGLMLEIGMAANLYFAGAKKSLEKMSKERLEEILLKLASNSEERKQMELIPSYWNPYAFFGYEKLQNLWKKA